MVVASPKTVRDVVSLSVPVVDLSWRRDVAAEVIVRACEELGFFKVINHGVPEEVVGEMESEGEEFFSLPAEEKRKAGPPNPLGYGSRSIGFNGDTGDLEYLLLHTNPSSVQQRATTICSEDPSKFSDVVNDYVDAVRELACELLDMVGEGLGLGDRRALSRLLRDSESDSLVRLNHYPPCYKNANANTNAEEIRKVCNKDGAKLGSDRIGFGEHSDPQIISILRSNNVEGLQILSSSSVGEVWIPVQPDPSAFFVHVGDTLEALTNGRLVSVRHRAISNSYRTRLSMIYFGAPPLNARISPLPETVTRGTPRRYKSFTWGEYKKTMYALRLSHNRLDLFRLDQDDDEESINTLKWL